MGLFRIYTPKFPKSIDSENKQINKFPRIALKETPLNVWCILNYMEKIPKTMKHVSWLPNKFFYMTYELTMVPHQNRWSIRIDNVSLSLCHYKINGVIHLALTQIFP